MVVIVNKKYCKNAGSVQHVFVSGNPLLDAPKVRSGPPAPPTPYPTQFPLTSASYSNSRHSSSPSHSSFPYSPTSGYIDSQYSSSPSNSNFHYSPSSIYSNSQYSVSPSSSYGNSQDSSSPSNSNYPHSPSSSYSKSQSSSSNYVHSQYSSPPSSSNSYGLPPVKTNVR